MAVDIFRSITMFVMIFVNDFWKIDHAPHFLDHAAASEDFMGLADMVFPCFLFAVGLSIPYAIEGRNIKGTDRLETLKHILSRSLTLIVMGLFVTNSEFRLSPQAPYSIGVYWILMVSAFILIWNSYPKSPTIKAQKAIRVAKVAGWLILLYLAITFRSKEGALFAMQWGILGTIGWAYMFSAIIYLFNRGKLSHLVIAWLIFIAINITGVPLREGAKIVDIADTNLYNQALTLLNIGGASHLILVISGVIFSTIVTRIDGNRRAIWLGCGTLLFAAAATAAHQLWKISKIYGTLPWILYIIAIAIALYGVVSWIVDRGYAGAFDIIKPAGTATLTCYMLPYISYAMADITGITLPAWFTHGGMGILNCLLFSLVIITATGLIGRLGIKLKI